MATFTATRAAATFPVGGLGEANSVKVAFGTIAIGTNPTAGDIYQMCRVPAGATVIGGYLQAVDLDTNATETLDLDIGWAANGSDAADPDGFGNLGVLTGDASVHLPVAGLYIPFAGVLQSAGPKTFARETTLQVECIATAATGGTGQMTLVAFYIIP